MTPTRVLVLLTALTWFPVGLVAPVVVLLGQERGLTVAEVGLAVVVYGVLVVVLELPTGGLADVVGRRPVLVAAGLAHLATCVALVVADDPAGFVVAFVLHAVGRALGSGPLEAWYVDTVRAADPRADLARGLGWQGVADGGGCALGAVLGGLVPTLADGALVVPVVLAAVADAGCVVAVLHLVREQRPPRQGSLLAAVGVGARQVPATVGTALRLGVGDPALRLVLAVAALGGWALGGLELLGPVRFADLAADREGGAALFGVVLAVSFGASALGSAGAVRARRLARGSTRVACAGAAAAGAAGLAGLGSLEAAVLAGTATALFYLAHGVAWPLLSAVAHDRVEAEQRATTVSAMSLAVVLGGTGGTLALPQLAERAGNGGAFLVAAGVFAAAVLACWRLPRGSGDQEPLLDEAPHDGEHLLGRLPLAEAGAGGEQPDAVAQRP